MRHSSNWTSGSKWGIAILVVGAACSALLAEPPIDSNEGRPHVSWLDAEQVIGRVAFVSGKVTEVRPAGRFQIIDFESARPPRFKAVVSQDDWPKFPKPLAELYEGRIVRIRGLVKTFQGKPEIQVTAPDQIEVLDELPPTTKPAARRVASGPELTFATYNVLNLFDDLDDPYHADEGTPAKPRDQLERVAQSIRKLDADVIALEEVENRWYLERFVEVFLPDLGYEVVQFEGNDLRGIDVCLLTRVPVGAVRSYRHLRFPGADGAPSRFERDVLGVELLPAKAEPIEVWVVHLKSNYGGRPQAEPIRLAEAHALRQLLDQQLARNPGVRLVVCGDFNDEWDSASTQAVVGSGAGALKCHKDDVPEADQITYNREPHRSMIDFLLLSPALDSGYVAESYRVWPGSVEETGSDHNAVSLRLRVR